MSLSVAHLFEGGGRVRHRDGTPVRVDGSGFLRAGFLVAEVTSDSTAERDREKKIHGYARAGIPLCLLIDRERGEVVVHSEPSGDDYAKGSMYKLGLAVSLSEPLGFELDTAEF